MRTQGFPEEQIKRLLDQVGQTEFNKIHKSICRWKVYGNPKKRLMIKAFDHLRMAIKMRKVLRYYLNFSNNRVQHVKADMQDAFRKWALGDSSQAIGLDRKDIEYLRQRNNRQT